MPLYCTITLRVYTCSYRCRLIRAGCGALPIRGTGDAASAAAADERSAARAEETAATCGSAGMRRAEEQTVINARNWTAPGASPRKYERRRGEENILLCRGYSRDILRRWVWIVGGLGLQACPPLPREKCRGIERAFSLYPRHEKPPSLCGGGAFLSSAPEPDGGKIVVVVLHRLRAHVFRCVCVKFSAFLGSGHRI